MIIQTCLLSGRWAWNGYHRVLVKRGRGGGEARRRGALLRLRSVGFCSRNLTDALEKLKLLNQGSTSNQLSH